MEKRLYFVIGDLFANVLVATVAVALTAWLMGGAWGMIPGMLAGMALGMLIALILGLGPLALMFGLMEVIAPCMISGMIGGMWGGMWPLAGAAMLRWGVGTGIVVIAGTYALNAVVAGPQTIGS